MFGEDTVENAIQGYTANRAVLLGTQAKGRSLVWTAVTQNHDRVLRLKHPERGKVFLACGLRSLVQCQPVLLLCRAVVR